MQPYYTLYYLISLTDNATIPAGSIFEYLGSNISANFPKNFVVCDGRIFTSNDTNICASSNSVCITPDLRGRTIIGEGNGPGLTSRGFKSTGGLENVTLTVGQIPSHSHISMCASSEIADLAIPSSDRVLARSSGVNAYRNNQSDTVMNFISNVGKLI
jgi:microcystin-dependent protein